MIWVRVVGLPGDMPLRHLTIRLFFCMGVTWEEFFLPLPAAAYKHVVSNISNAISAGLSGIALFRHA